MCRSPHILSPACLTTKLCIKAHFSRKVALDNFADIFMNYINWTRTCLSLRTCESQEGSSLMPRPALVPQMIPGPSQRSPPSSLAWSGGMTWVLTWSQTSRLYWASQIKRSGKPRCAFLWRASVTWHGAVANSNTMWLDSEGPRYGRTFQSPVVKSNTIL